MAEGFEQLSQGTTVFYGVSAGIWIMVVFAAPIKADMLLARGALATMAKRHQQPFPTLTWCLAEAGYRMDADARTAATDVTRDFAANIIAEATLIEGQGFQSAAVRAIIAGMDAMSRTASKKKVFGELAPSVQWCLEARPGGVGQSDLPALVKALEEARKRFARLAA